MHLFSWDIYKSTNCELRGEKLMIIIAINLFKSESLQVLKSQETFPNYVLGTLCTPKIIVFGFFASLKNSGHWKKPGLKSAMINNHVKAEEFASIKHQ